jgi:hypothetical protein
MFILLKRHLQISIVWDIGLDKDIGLDDDLKGNIDLLKHRVFNKNPQARRHMGNN